MQTRDVSRSALSHPRPLVWGGRVLIALLATLLLLMAMGAGYQFVATQQDRQAHPPPGDLVHVEGSAFHLDCRGEGAPTVLLEAGSGSTSSQWAWILPRLATTTRTCAYDRAGMGWSVPRGTERDAQTVARELHTLLEAAQIPGPYVLVGHSAGALYVWLYTALFPEEVAGLVLLDPVHPEQFEQMPASYEQMCLPPLHVALAYLDVTRLVNPARGVERGLGSS